MDFDKGGIPRVDSNASTSCSSTSSMGSGQQQQPSSPNRRSGARQDSDLYSFHEPGSYNEWKYGDEASLYSIAEDSREDRESEVPSMAGSVACSSIKGGLGGGFQQELGDDSDMDQTIEVCWATGGETQVMDHPANKLTLPRNEVGDDDAAVGEEVSIFIPDSVMDGTGKMFMRLKVEN